MAKPQRHNVESLDSSGRRNGHPVGSQLASPPEPAIRSERLTRDFSAVRAVDKLDLQVPRGSVFGFLGPNGAGKTTTIRLLLGLLEPTRGRARVMGFDCVTQSRQVRKRCGVLLEHSGLIERMTARENLETYGRIWRIPPKIRHTRIEQLLKRLNLWERRDDKVRKWSRGMKQKLAIARTLVHRPALIFLDEPTAGLDPVAAAELREDLLRLASQERVTVFLTTHHLSEAERVCDLVAVIRQGRLLSVGTPDELRARSVRHRVRLGGSGFNDNVVQLLTARTEVTALSRRNGALYLDLREEADIPALVRFLVRLGVDLDEVARVDNSLEEVFLSLVRGAVSGDGSWLVTERYRGT